MKAIIFPGQGAQYKGMGKDLFEKYPELVNKASSILGYDLMELCLEDPNDVMSQTQFTQPARYFVSALHYRAYITNGGTKPDYLLGHSLGEYNALQAAGAFSLFDGLRLVAKRGELMAQVHVGGMIAVLGQSKPKILSILNEHGLQSIDLANYNTDTQLVISGKVQDIEKAKQVLNDLDVINIPLNVRSPFHSRYMEKASQNFRSYIDHFQFNPIAIPVISNLTGKQHITIEIKDNLSQQIVKPVLWSNSVQYLLNIDEKMEFEEIGSTILTKMVKQIRSSHSVEQNKPTEPKVSFNPRSKLKLFCIPHAGGDFRSFLALKKKLDFDVIVLERPGRGRRMSEPLLSNFDDVVRDLYEQISSQIDDSPYGIFGHSFGARLSFRLCQEIRKNKLLLPKQLYVSGDTAPVTSVQEQNTWKLDKNQFWERLKQIGGCPSELFEYPELLDFFEKIIRADLEALSSFTHRQESPFSFGITAMLGSKEELSREEVNQWSDETAGAFRYKEFEGGHFFIQQHTSEIAKMINSDFNYDLHN